MAQDKYGQKISFRMNNHDLWIWLVGYSKIKRYKNVGILLEEILKDYKKKSDLK